MWAKYKTPVLLVTVSATLSFFAAEAILRFAGVSYPSFYAWDEHIGIGPYPGAEGRWSGEGEEHYVTYNRQGLRDRDHRFAKEEHVLRILILGDSFVEALQLPIEGSFWYLLQEDLTPCLPPPWSSVEVINFGVSGTGTGQQLLKLRHQRGFDYSPDIVLLALFPGNDIRNNSLALEKSAYLPYFQLAGGELVLSTEFRDGFLSRWVRPTKLYRGWIRFRGWSRLAQLVNRLPVIWRTRKRRAAAASRGELANQEAGIDGADVFREPRNETWRQAWDVTEALIEQMNREVEANGARFVTAIVSTGAQVNPNPKVRGRLESALGVPDLFYPDRRIVQVGKRAGFPVLDLPPRFQDYAERTGRHLHGFSEQRPGRGHWNRLGHQLASSFIAEDLCQLLGDSEHGKSP